MQLCGSVTCINIVFCVNFTLEKAKPKTIADIAKILQQKTKENNDREQLVKTQAAFSARPATPNQYDAGVDFTKNLLKVKTASSTPPANVSTLVDKELARDVSDREAFTKKSASLTGACESVLTHDLPQDVISSYETVASKEAFYITTSIPELDASTETVQAYSVTANTKVTEVLATLHAHETPAASDVSSPEAVYESHAVEIVSPFGDETKKIGVEDGEVHDASSSSNLKEPAVVHTEILEEKTRTDTVEESPAGTSDCRYCKIFVSCILSIVDVILYITSSLALTCL